MSKRDDQRSAAGPDHDAVPDSRDLQQLRRAAAECRRCELYRDATQTVFGSGRDDARVVLIGEQPGDTEDIEGEPFVGPAGRLLHEAMSRAGFDPATVYLTNAVKHFRGKASDTGKRRLHQTPTRTQAVACRPWLVAELHAIQPDVVIALGAVAAKSILGPDFVLTNARGHAMPWPKDIPGGPTKAFFATLHPSAVLRAAAERRRATMDGFVSDLSVAWRAL